MWRQIKVLFSRRGARGESTGPGQDGPQERLGEPDLDSSRPIGPDPNSSAKDSSERRERRDRRQNDRRLDERRKAGIGEIMEDRRTGPRRQAERRTEEDRRGPRPR
jgi:hypothetical protein